MSAQSPTGSSSSPPLPTLPIVSLAASAVVLSTSVSFLQVLTVPLGLGCLALGYLAHRRTRAGTPRDRALGLAALVAAVLPLVAGIFILGVALMVSGFAVFTG